MNFKNKLLLNLYKGLWSVAEPLSYMKASKEKFSNEFEANINFFLIETFNKLPHDMKQTLFGKQDISRNDITWEWLNNVLMPDSFAGAVYRENYALNGSDHNEKFSAQRIKDGMRFQYYTPSTITIYPNKKRSEAAAVVLNILLSGSSATVIAEGVRNFQVDRDNILRDNVLLNVHNSLRLFESHLWSFVPEEKKPILKDEAQKMVNERLPEGDRWEAFEGITVFSTLAGRPNVKMFKKTTNSKGKEIDDPEDVKMLELIEPQTLPSIVSNLPKVPGFTKDGRIHKNDSWFLKKLNQFLGEQKFETFCDVMRTSLGDKTFEAIFNANRKMAGEIIKEEGFGFEKSFVANSKAVSGALGYLGDFIIMSTSFAFLISAYLVSSVISNVINIFSNENVIGNKLRKYVENKIGYNFTSATITKTWERRGVGNIARHSAEKASFGIEVSAGQNKPETLGVFMLTTPCFKQKINKIYEIDEEVFSDSVLDSCKSSEKLNKLLKFDNSEQIIKNFALNFAKDYNKFVSSFDKDGQKTIDKMLLSKDFADSLIKLSELSSNVTTPVLRQVEPEIKSIMQRVFNNTISIAHSDYSVTL